MEKKKPVDEAVDFINNNFHCERRAWNEDDHGEAYECADLPAGLEEAIRVPFEFIKESVGWLGRSFEGHKFLSVHKDGTRVLFVPQRTYNLRPPYEWEPLVLAVCHKGHWYSRENLARWVGTFLKLGKSGHKPDRARLEKLVEQLYLTGRTVDVARRAEHSAAENLYEEMYGREWGWKSYDDTETTMFFFSRAETPDFVGLQKRNELVWRDGDDDEEKDEDDK